MLPSTTASDHGDKRRRLAVLKHDSPYVTQSALGSIIKHISDHGLPCSNDEGISRHSIRRARDADLLVNTPFGPLLTTIEVPAVAGGVFHFEVACPFGMLYLAAQTQYFGQLLWNTYIRDPPSAVRPWGVVIYSDEVTPGNAMKIFNERMTQSIYWSFVNFGSAALSKEDNWFTWATIKSSDVREVDGGMSCIIAELVKAMFHPTDHAFHRAGILVNGGRIFDSIRIFAEFSCCLSDESALHQTWMCKGAGGVKCCVECLYIVNPHWMALEALPDDANLKPFTDPSTWDASALVPHDIYTIHAIVDDLKAVHDSGALAPTPWVEKQRRVGFSHNNNSILLNPALRSIVDPSKQNCFDWPHCVLAGIFPVVVGNIATALHSDGARLYEPLNEHVRLFTWPKSLAEKGATGVKCFIPRRATSSRKAKLWKASQSEMLSVFMVVAHWFRAVVQPSGMLPLACNCLAALTLLTSMYVASAKGLVDPIELAKVIRMFMESYAVAFGLDGMIPKFHYIVHSPQSLRKWGFLPNTLALERKHKTIKNTVRRSPTITSPPVALYAKWRRNTCTHCKQLII